MSGSSTGRSPSSRKKRYAAKMKSVRAGTWYLRDAHSGGAADLVLGFGDVGDEPLVWR